MMKVPKIPMIMHEKCMKSRNKLEKEGQKGLIGLQGKKPYKNLEGKRQKLDGGAQSQREEREKKRTI